MFFAIIIPLGLLLVLGDLVVAAIGFIVAALIIGVLVLLATGVAYDVMTANPLLGISGVLDQMFARRGDPSHGMQASEGCAG